MEYQNQYASRGTGTAALTTGIIGTAGTALGLLGNGMGILSGNYEDQHITRHEMDLVREIMSKDQQIAISDSENYTDKKLVEVYNALAKSDKEIRAEIETNYREQAKINAEQGVYNGVNSATLNCMQSRIDELLALTARRVPNSSICPGWGPVNVSPVEGGTTIG